MPLETTGKNALLGAVSTAFTHVGAVTDLAGTEVTGGSYARQANTWAAAASGSIATSAQASVPIPAGTTVVATANYSASSGGNRQSISQIGSTLRGVATVSTGDVFTSVAHGLAADDRVFVFAAGGDALPTGLSAGTLYWVRSSGLTADAFTLSTSQGGAAVDVTAASEVGWARTVPQAFSIAGNLVLPATTGNVVDLNGFG